MKDSDFQILREYMTYGKISIDNQQYILTAITSIFKTNVDSINDCITEILLDGKLSFSDIPQIIKLISSSVGVICLIDPILIPNKFLLKYLIFYTILDYAGRDIHLMPNEDLYLYYDSVYELLLSKIAKVNMCC